MPVHVTRLHLRDDPHNPPPPTSRYPLTLPPPSPSGPPLFMPGESVISFFVYIRAGLAVDFLEDTTAKTSVHDGLCRASDCFKQPAPAFSHRQHECGRVFSLLLPHPRLSKSHTVVPRPGSFAVTFLAASDK